MVNSWYGDTGLKIFRNWKLSHKNIVFLLGEFGFKKMKNYECTALTNWATGPRCEIFTIFYLTYQIKKIMVGRVGYAPTTPAMSMQYSTIELTALTF